MIFQNIQKKSEQVETQVETKNDNDYYTEKSPLVVEDQSKSKTTNCECVSGYYKCIGNSSFQECSNGTWNTIMSCGPGTNCTPFQANYIICN